MGRTIPNPAVSSIFSQGCWLRLGWEKHPATFPFFGFPPSKFHHLLKHQQLLSELHERCILDLFDALNPAVAPFVHTTTCCGSAIENILQLSDFRNSADNFIPHKDHQHYSQKIREGRSLDIVDVLNPAAVSVCPHDRWLSFRH